MWGRLACDGGGRGELWAQSHPLLLLCAWPRCCSHSNPVGISCTVRSCGTCPCWEQQEAAKIKGALGTKYPSRCCRLLQPPSRFLPPMVLGSGSKDREPGWRRKDHLAGCQRAGHLAGRRLLLRRLWLVVLTPLWAKPNWGLRLSRLPSAALCVCTEHPLVGCWCH